MTEKEWIETAAWAGRLRGVQIYRSGRMWYNAPIIPLEIPSYHCVPVGRAKVEKLEAAMDIPYEKGKLEAVAYRGGKQTARTVLETTGPACRVAATADRAEIRADQQDLAYVSLTLTDGKGARVPDETRKIHIEVTGAGHLAGIGNGNPCTEENYGTPYCLAYEGRAMAAVVADAAGEIRIRAWADGLEPAEITVQAR